MLQSLIALLIAFMLSSTNIDDTLAANLSGETEDLIAVETTLDLPQK